MTNATASARWIAVVPNVLSTARLALALAFPVLPTPWRLPAVVAAGLTDYLDGLIARRFGVQSVAGGLLDAVADKLFALAVLLAFALDGHVAWWQILLILSRDVVVALISLYLALTKSWSAFSRMPSRALGRVTTGLLFAWFLAVLLPAPDVLTHGLFVALVGSSVLAAVDYGTRFTRALRAGSS